MRGRMRSASGTVFGSTGAGVVVEQAHDWLRSRRVRCRCASYSSTAAATAALAIRPRRAWEC